MRNFLIAAMLAALGLSGACSKGDDAPPEAATPAQAEKPAQAAHDEHEGAHEDEHDDAAEPRVVTMDAAERTAAGIRLATVDASALVESIRAPGEVADDAYGTTLITPRVAALVVRRHARLGDEVAANAPLITLSSVDVSQAQGALRSAEQDWQRVQSLGREAVSARRYAEAQIAVEQARAAAQAYGIGGASPGTASGEFTLLAPHAGRITEDAFVIGERIEPGRALFRLVDESVVWIDATLPAITARRIAVGSVAQVVIGATRLEGKVVQRAHRTTEGTRAARVRVEVANTADALHTGDYVEVYLEADPVGPKTSPVISVPNDALIQFNGETVVFRASENDTLIPVVVRTGDVVGDRTLVLDGLANGDAIVVDGAFTLKARLLKADIGEGHAH
jgi:membrane fusion protein, heavy metal efflux system